MRSPFPLSPLPSFTTHLQLTPSLADAFCAIDISHSARATSDTITPSLLKAHALTLLTICVQGSPSIGGVSSGLGEGGNLALRVTPYRPKVHCFGPGTAPPWSTCREVVDSMSVSGRTLRFGPVEDVLAEVVVPWVRTTRERRCAIVCMGGFFFVCLFCFGVMFDDNVLEKNDTGRRRRGKKERKKR